MTAPFRKLVALLVLLLAGAGSGAIAMPLEAPLGDVSRLLGVSLDGVVGALRTIGALAGAGLSEARHILGRSGLVEFAPSLTLMAGVVVGIGASLLALAVALVVGMTRSRPGRGIG